MTNKEAASILENMAVDLVGALSGLSSANPIFNVIEQRIEAINMAQRALNSANERKVCELHYDSERISCKSERS